MRGSAGLGSRRGTRPERSSRPAADNEITTGPGHVVKLPQPSSSKRPSEAARWTEHAVSQVDAETQFFESTVVAEIEVPTPTCPGTSGRSGRTGFAGQSRSPGRPCCGPSSRA